MRRMGDALYHSKIASEKRTGALDEFADRRYTNVADLTLKAVEQAIEACASRQNLHFHTDPKSAHAERSKWLKERFPELAKSFDALWGTYAVLGYGGLDGKRARKAIEEMERILDVLQKKTRIRIK